MKFIHPFMVSVVSKIDTNIIYIVISISTVIFIIDAITSIVKVKNIKQALEKVEELNNQIKEKLKEIKKITDTEKNAEKIDVKENIQKLIEQLNKKKERITTLLYKNVYRLKKAFPAIDTKEIREILNKKIEFSKNNNNKKKDINKKKN